VDDAELVERIRKRDRDAFRILYTRYIHYLAGVVFSLLGADSELDDVLQETLLEAVGSLDRLEDPASLRRWLVTIAVRRVQRALHRRKRRRWIASHFAVVAPKWLTSAAEWPLSELQLALDALPPKVRIPWILRRIEELELADVASACSISMATAKRRVATADERIRRWFDAR
jgi:RNA polymerase sigma-70 factor (ECF subfamily)